MNPDLLVNRPDEPVILPEEALKPPVTRRRFLRRTLRAGLALTGLGAATAGYGVWESSHIQLRRDIIRLPHLPPAFAGKTLAVLGDFHHGPFVSIEFIREAVRLTNSLSPDIVALVGDFANIGSHWKYLPPCLEALSRIEAPLGVFAVPGNHDTRNGKVLYVEAIGNTSLIDLRNRAVRTSLGGESLWLAGVEDLWWGRPDQNAALREVPERAAVIMLAHNPDFAEEKPDSRVGLVVSGHLHGGQIYLPALGLSWQPSKYGSKYRRGLVQGPKSQVFVTCGVGTTGLPLRINCPPEINLLTLVNEI